MRLRLNLWQRLGIVASAVWFCGAWLVTMDREGNAMARLAFGPCYGDGAPSPAPPNCGYATYETLIRAARDAALINALLPVIAGWMVAYTVLWIGRWVWAGRGAV